MRLLIRKKIKSNVYWCPVEMKHRALETVCILTKSKLNNFTGVICQGTLIVQDFIEAKVAVTKKPLTEQFEKHIDKGFLPKTKESEIFDKEVHVTFDYATKPDVNTEDLLTVFHTKSRYISAANINSARKPPTADITKWGRGSYL